MKKLIAGLGLFLLSSLTAFAAVDLNTATQAELEAVKGIGPSKAKAIIAYREKNGGFKSVEELAKVKGFGKVSAGKLKGEFEIKAAPAK
ncbi:helix-hairpin-helix domain-containing protein [Parasulfuritortus cantonensis]|uniref:Helix-hairpin-helix domain-containing protein n=1 Tax=Parasulfuritortus cantonensis TaxID=2528202 RepID=A0A4R1B4R6_9PROT|nr:helix-hairpin-helix domain-containing protein [Parasulfuritortus cantonensis]TCJ12931.1 helix-hairpin-helix domain-containing protein [Parasulfuritortus cantonensis]